MQCYCLYKLHDIAFHTHDKRNQEQFVVESILSYRRDHKKRTQMYIHASLSYPRYIYIRHELSKLSPKELQQPKISVKTFQVLAMTACDMNS